MTDLVAPFDAEPVQRSADTEAPPRAPVLITEQQVLFATAGAVPLQPARTTRRWIDAVLAFVTMASVRPGKETHPKRRHYPPRKDIFEDSRMAREMLRL